MTFKTDFYRNLTDAVKAERAELNRLQAELKEVESICYSNKRDSKYSPKYIHDELMPKIGKIKREMADRKAMAHDRIQSMCDGYITELMDEDELDPSKLTDDLRLLNSGVTLTQRDIKSMLNRNSDNRTMIQLILRFADQHGIETDGIHYVGNRALINTVKVIPTVTDACIKNHYSESVMETLMGEGSDLANSFSED